MSPSLHLQKNLTLIKKLFNIDHLLTKIIDKEYIKLYYQTNQLAYSIFHSQAGYIHMGLSKGDKFRADDLIEPVRTIEKIFKPSTKQVLELACGRGANSAYLARRHPKITFTGIDLSQHQLKFAAKKFRELTNLSLQEGDYHNLSQFPAKSFDLVFIIEALCYSLEKETVFKETRRVLRPGGIFIVIDGYRNTLNKKLTSDEEVAIQLAERGMAVELLENYQNVLHYAISHKFKVVEVRDVSKQTLPTLRRFEATAKFFTLIPLLPKLLIKLFPKEFTYNTLSALLMPAIVELGLGVYSIMIFQKDS